MRKRFGRWLALAFVAALLMQSCPALAARALYLSKQEITLPMGDSQVLSANQPVIWSSGNPKVATVEGDGTVTAHQSGQVLIYASTGGQKKAVRVTVKAVPKPARVEIKPETATISLLEPHQLSATVWPESASQSVTWSSSNRKIATVSSAGLVTPKKAGKVRISVRAKAKTSVRTSIVLTIVDPRVPTSIEIAPKTGYLNVNETQAIMPTVLPQTADQGVVWTSSKPAVASVDERGVVTALSAGRATITAQTVRGQRKAQATFVVFSGVRESEVPARTTGKSAAAVKRNLAAIDSVYVSAVEEIEVLLAKKAITQADYDKRKKILINAFSMYRFPWDTTQRVAYWSSSYNGLKDFRTGRMYYGLPYIQTGADQQYTNRRYNVAKAVSGGFYRKAAGGTYRMTAKRQGGRYVGNDCSSFVCMATFAGNGFSINSSVCYMVTSEMAKSTRFRTIKYADLRPGDMLVWSGSHSVFFLYYLDDDKKRMMILEQGGGNTTTDVHNTVTCSVVNTSSYTKNYIARRASFLK